MEPRKKATSLALGILRLNMAVSAGDVLALVSAWHDLSELVSFGKVLESIRLDTSSKCVSITETHLPLSEAISDLPDAVRRDIHSRLMKWLGALWVVVSEKACNGEHRPIVLQILVDMDVRIQKALAVAMVMEGAGLEAASTTPTDAGIPHSLVYLWADLKRCRESVFPELQALRQEQRSVLDPDYKQLFLGLP